VLVRLAVDTNGLNEHGPQSVLAVLLSKCAQAP
jgi:hypothetical protein